MSLSHPEACKILKKEAFCAVRTVKGFCARNNKLT